MKRAEGAGRVDGFSVCVLLFSLGYCDRRLPSLSRHIFTPVPIDALQNSSNSRGPVCSKASRLKKLTKGLKYYEVLLYLLLKCLSLLMLFVV